MNHRTIWRVELAVSLFAMTLFAAAGPASAQGPNVKQGGDGGSNSCPNGSLKGFKAAANVGASFSNVGDVTTYRFISFLNESPVNGVPGLIKYCIYTDPAGSVPLASTVAATGADGQLWTFNGSSKGFAFARPGGNKSNIPLDGGTTTMGSATWGTTPTEQTILLHIADPAVCANLYGGTAPTCFVKPSTSLSCSAGEGSASAAYNAIPYGGVNCAPPSVGVEAYGFNELGDQVTLATGTGRQLDSLIVLFTSYGCSVSGHWYSGDCVTTAGATFDVPITARIYNPANCSGTPLICSGAPLATVTTTQTIPFRPSADPTNCGGPDPNGYAAGSRWFNPLGNGGAGACQYSIGKLLTFDFSAQDKTVPDDVIWTVAYNTSHSGYNPIAVPLGAGAACESSAAGCGYDSLNVGVKSYTGAPYAGTDDAENTVFLNLWEGNSVPQYPPPFGFGVLTPAVGVESTTDAIIPSWIGYRPLGEIITE